MFKKLIIIFILFILPAKTFAHTHDIHIEYSGFPFEFKQGDYIEFAKNARKNLLMYENSKDKTDKLFHLNEAMRYYFLLSIANRDSIEAQIGLGKIYDELGMDRYAKKHFFNAYNMNPNNPHMNLLFANFYYKRNDLINAQRYYERAYKYGYSKNYHLNHRLGCLYEKLADLENAKKFYSRAYAINSVNPELAEKVNSIDMLNYSESQYYIFKK